MTGFLLHLYGPMQAWGDTGFGQLREAGEFPSRAAVLGLIAAAEGIPRGDTRLVDLHAALRSDVATIRPGDVRRDFHTVETRKGGNRTLTSRDYHHDAHFVALVTGEPEVIIRAASALRRPAFGTFLGRRSCPPAVPLWPDPVTGDPYHALVEAVRETARAFPHGDATWRRTPRRTAPPTVWLDGHVASADLPAALTPAASVTWGSRRARLVGPRRAYAAAPFTRVRLGDAAPPDPHLDTFDAAPEPSPTAA